MDKLNLQWMKISMFGHQAKGDSRAYRITEKADGTCCLYVDNRKATCNVLQREHNIELLKLSAQRIENGEVEL